MDCRRWARKTASTCIDVAKFDERALTTADITSHCDVFDSGHAHFLKNSAQKAINDLRYVDRRGSKRP